MLFGETVAVYCENHTEHTDTVRTSQEIRRVPTTEPNRLMLFGETVAVYCENHTEHTDTVRTSQEPYGTHRYSPYLTGTIRNTQIQSLPHRNHTEHTDTVPTSQEPYGTLRCLLCESLWCLL
jgi:hypothetical protein